MQGLLLPFATKGEVMNVARLELNTKDFDARVWCLQLPPGSEFQKSSESSAPPTWSAFLTDSYYDNLVCVKRANIIPRTKSGTICTFLPFFHAAVLCFSDDWLESVLLVKHTATLNWLMREFPPAEDKTVKEINVGCRPQLEPRRFDRMLDMIYPFESFRVMSKPVWGSAALQAEAHAFQHSIRKLSGIDEDFSGTITYYLNADAIRLEISYESYMIYQNYRAIMLVQNDRVAGT